VNEEGTVDTKYFQKAVRMWLKECDDDAFAQAIIDSRKLPTATLSMLLRRAPRVERRGPGAVGVADAQLGFTRLAKDGKAVEATPKWHNR
jgi:hypothetical protein